MHTIIGYDDEEEYRDDYHGLLAHVMGGFYALDLKALISAKQDELAVECEFTPLETLDNQGIEIPQEVKAEAYEFEDGFFIGVVRTREEQKILYWVTGRKFGKCADGKARILPSGSYSPNGTSVIGESLNRAFAAAFKA